MKKIFFLCIIGVFSLFMNSCKQTQSPEVKRLSPEGIHAVGPYLSKDHRGNTVLCWTEQNPDDSLYYLKYAVFDTQLKQFNKAIAVPATAGMSLSAESMGKIAFKDDGTVIAVFSKSFPGEKNKYAGAIYYCSSEDNGNHWSEPRFLHTDTSRTYGRSFFDVARLADGEVCAVWLDGRFGEEEKGSALFFSRTEKGEGFARDTCLDKNTCECCRTEILTDQSGRIHIAYRGIQFPSGVLGKQVRDMVYTTSADNGRTFSAARVISKDQWEIQGCPHTGPTLAATKNALHALWFTGGGTPGLYASSLKAGEVDFRDRVLISKSGRHPQMVEVDGKLATVWEESLTPAQDQHKETNTNHSNMETMNHGEGHASSAASSQVVLTVADEEGNAKNKVLISDEKEIADHAVITTTERGVLIAWVQGGANDSGIFYSSQLID